MDRGAVAAGQIVSCHRDEVVLATLQVEDQDVFDLLLTKIKIWRCWAVYKNLKLNVHRTTYMFREVHTQSKGWVKSHNSEMNYAGPRLLHALTEVILFRDIQSTNTTLICDEISSCKKKKPAFVNQNQTDLSQSLMMFLICETWRQDVIFYEHEIWGSWKKPWLYVLLTLSYEAFAGVGCEPGLAVCRLIWLLDKLKLTWDLPVIEEAQCVCPVLHELHILKVKLKGGGKICEARQKTSMACNCIL